MFSLQPPRHIPTLPKREATTFGLTSASTSCGHHVPMLARLPPRASDFKICRELRVGSSKNRPRLRRPGFLLSLAKPSGAADPPPSRDSSRPCPDGLLDLRQPSAAQKILGGSTPPAAVRLSLKLAGGLDLRLLPKTFPNGVLMGRFYK
jgi:hypothetical protein